MRSCPNCKNGVEETALKCPHCGVALNFGPSKEITKEKTKVENPKQSSFKGWPLIALCIALFFVLNSFVSPKLSQQLPTGNVASAPVLTGMEGITYGFKAIPERISNYLKTSTQYSTYYNANKKFGIYFTGADCPHLQAFDSAMNSIINDSNYQQYYNFRDINVNQGIQTFTSKEEAQNDVDFNDMCQAFCIVNPNKNEIFYIDGVGEAEAAKLPYIFDNLKTW